MSLNGFARMSRKALLAGTIAALAAPVAAHQTPEELDEAVRAFILNNPEVILESVQLYQQELEAREQAALAERRLAYLEENRELVYDDGYSVVLGNPEGDVTLVEFFDYRCGFCRRAAGEVFALLEADPGVRLVLKEFPILGEESDRAARASVAAAEQDRGSRFVEFHLALLAETGPITVERVLELAVDAGFDPAPIRAAMESGVPDSTIRTNRLIAQRLEINGTPAFVMADEVVPGYVELPVLTEWVLKARAGS